MKLRRVGVGGVNETLTIPNHRELDTGTCRAILRQVSRYVPASELAPFFYSDWE
ncbi:MAG TPA: type II toxin-antitoxin system HicA family toxin [Terriglobia bacterium]|nr:type II toxin-antitoxin system HicA family toxin [Terriglobia bacterium]